jgi:gluconolactonase
VEPLIPIDRFEIFATGIDHPECVAFDRDGFLWAGGEAGQVYRIDPAGKVEQVCTLGSFNGGLAFSPEDELFVCNPAKGIVRVGRDGKQEVFAMQADGTKILCANFIVFDAAGNLYVTDSGDWQKGNGRLCRFTPDGQGKTLAGPFGYANGLALSADERFLFMVESDSERVFRFDLSTGKHAVLAEGVSRLPDGLALDSAGNLYVTCYASDDIHRVTLAGKRELVAHDRWAIKISRPTNLAFHDGWMYVANLGRQTISRTKVDFQGQPLVNQRMRGATETQRSQRRS